ncbi:MAG: WcaI family glycosyltransferase, partial [Marinobacter sp.]
LAPHVTRTLILGLNFAPEPISTAPYTTRLARYLARHGHRVHVVTATPFFPAWSRPKDWPRARYVARDPVLNLRVTHCPHYIPRHPTGLRRLLHQLSFTFAATPVMIAQALRHPPDRVLVIAPALLAAPLGWLAARIAGAPAWLHLQDLELDAARATGIVGSSRLAALIERWVLRRFDRISTISAPMCARVAAKGVAPHRIQELRNWAEPMASPDPDAIIALRRKLGISTPHVLLYSGALGRKQGLEAIPDLAHRLRHRRDLTLLICGDGPMRPMLEQAAREHPNLCVAPLQPRERLSALLGLATVHFLPQIADAADLVLPSKLTNMLASGRPVLATAAPGTALAAEVAGCGVVVPPGDTAALVVALDLLLQDPDRRAALGRAGLRAAQDRWHADTILARWHDELGSLTRGSAQYRASENASATMP